MIRDFWVKNYLSIRDKQELNFVAKGPSSELVTEVADGVFLYKLGILYGSNASGKSNMLIAMNEVFRLLVMPKSDATVGIGGCIPFVLTKDEPTEMHASFYADGTRYDYDVKFNGKNILSEALYYYPNKSKSLFYERSFVGENVQADIKFGASLKLQVKTQESIRENTLNNHSVLSVCRKAALKEDIAPFNTLHAWIMSNYHDVDGDVEKGLVEILKDAYSNPKKRKFYNTMLQKADLNILEYRPVVEDRIVPNDFRERIQKENIPEEMKDVLLKPTTDSITFLNHSDDGDFDIPLRWQSKGTQKYIRILDALYDLITSPHVYYLDELGEDLHNDLLYYYLNVFIFNSDKSQLVITSQETTLLSQDMINENRGVVWFVEKNKETASSEYARGDSFGLHKNLSLYNSYRIGRLGAKPELGSIFINLED
ncbi:AAA family ATPase [Coprobacter fastidiosus]|uniref:AAA family ATPase n=1 Tax=Coprobacter fastidiosus TaxID=1099853 RepID=UPI002675494E|nr:ATP-binding protein [Coprobacter fastidiosus]